MDRQGTFDRVAKHLLTQNAKAISSGGSCMYLSRDGLRCAIGCLIPDGHPGLTTAGGLDTLLCKHPDLRSILGVSDVEQDEDHHLLRNLQSTHDGWDAYQWRLKLIELASVWKLKDDVPVSFAESTPSP